MRRMFVSLILFCAASAAVTAKPDGAAYGQISVGKDNLIRICWAYYGGAAGEGFQIETIDAAGNLKKMGPKYGPYSGWYLNDLATGPNNDTVVAMMNPGGKQFSMLRLNSSNERSATYTYPIETPLTMSSSGLGLGAIDSNDLAWFLLVGVDASDSARGIASLRAWPASKSGSVTRGGGYADDQFFGTLRIRNDGTKCIIGWSDRLPRGTSTVYISYLVPSSSGIFGTLLEQPPIATGRGGMSDPNWLAWGMTATPDNHLQLYWTCYERTPVIWKHLVIWDIAPDGSIRQSPDFASADWWFWDMAASALSGGDGQLRLLYHANASPDQFAILSLDRNSWAFTATAYR